MKIIYFYDIDYETDGEDVDLPKELTLQVDDDIDIEGQGTDLISDETGWLVNGFCWEIKKVAQIGTP